MRDKNGDKIVKSRYEYKRYIYVFTVLQNESERERERGEPFNMLIFGDITIMV